MVFPTGRDLLLGLVSSEPIVSQIENLPDQEADEQNGNRADNSGAAAIFIVEYKNQRGSHRHDLDG
jgi:hypothetical protein